MPARSSWRRSSGAIGPDRKILKIVNLTFYGFRQVDSIENAVMIWATIGLPICFTVAIARILESAGRWAVNSGPTA